MNLTCFDCKFMVQIYVKPEDPPLSWCNCPSTKDLKPPIGYVRRDAPQCKYFARMNDVRKFDATVHITEEAKPDTTRICENKIVIMFCFLMTLLTLLTVLFHQGEQVVTAFGQFLERSGDVVQINH